MIRRLLRRPCPACNGRGILAVCCGESPDFDCPTCALWGRCPRCTRPSLIDRLRKAGW